MKVRRHKHAHAVTAARLGESGVRTILSEMREGILAADVATRQLRYANPAICALLGYSEAELLRLGLNDVHPKEIVPMVSAQLEPQRRGGHILATEVPCLRRDGSIFFADIKATSIVIDGQPLAVRFFMDVTTRKLAEEKFAFAFKSAAYPMAIADLETGRIIEANEALAASLGYSKEEIIGRGTKDLGIWVAPAERDRMTTLAKTQGSFRGFHALVRNKNGEVRRTLFSGGVFSVAGRGYFVTTSLDITDAKRAEEELAISERKFRLAFNVGPDPMAIADPQIDTLLEVNEAFTAWSGYTRAELIGRSTLGLGLWARPETRHPLVGMIEAGSARATGKVRLKDGSLRDVILMASKLEIGGRACALTLLHDITDSLRLLEEERKTRAEAEAASKAKDNFLAVVSHELRTPLTSIQGFAWLLRNSETGKQEWQEAADAILRSTQREQQIIDEVIDSANLAHGQTVMAKRIVDLADVVKTACESVKQQAQNPSIGSPETCKALRRSSRTQQGCSRWCVSS